MTEALKADWYDLAENDAGRFLDWLHGTYLPALMALPGIAWAGHYRISPKGERAVTPGSPPRRSTDDPSVPAGSQYVLLAAAPSADVFFASDGPIPAFEKANAARLKARRNHRDAVFIEESRVDGLEHAWRSQGRGAPPAMQLGNFIVRSPADEVELARYYRESRWPDLMRCRGCIGARKLLSIAGWPKHGILYEFTGMDDDEELFERRMAAARQGPRVGRSVVEFVIHAPHAPHAGVRIWPTV